MEFASGVLGSESPLKSCPIHASRNDSNANGVYANEGCASHEIGIYEYLLSFLN